MTAPRLLPDDPLAFIVESQLIVIEQAITKAYDDFSAKLPKDKEGAFLALIQFLESIHSYCQKQQIKPSSSMSATNVNYMYLNAVAENYLQALIMTWFTGEAERHMLALALAETVDYCYAQFKDPTNGIRTTSKNVSKINRRHEQFLDAKMTSSPSDVATVLHDELNTLWPPVAAGEQPLFLDLLSGHRNVKVIAEKKPDTLEGFCSHSKMSVSYITPEPILRVHAHQFLKNLFDHEALACELHPFTHEVLSALDQDHCYLVLQFIPQPTLRYLTPRPADSRLAPFQTIFNNLKQKYHSRGKNESDRLDNFWLKHLNTIFSNLPPNQRSGVESVRTRAIAEAVTRLYAPYFNDPLTRHRLVCNAISRLPAETRKYQLIQAKVKSKSGSNIHFDINIIDLTGSFPTPLDNSSFKISDLPAHAIVLPYLGTAVSAPVCFAKDFHHKMSAFSDDFTENLQMVSCQDVSEVTSARIDQQINYIIAAVQKNPLPPGLKIIPGKGDEHLAKNAQKNTITIPTAANSQTPGQKLRAAAIDSKVSIEDFKTSVSNQDIYAAIDEPDEVFGRTALHWVATIYPLDRLKIYILLNAKADDSLRDYFGKTVYEIMYDTEQDHNRPASKSNVPETKSKTIAKPRTPAFDLATEKGVEKLITAASDPKGKPKYKYQLAITILQENPHLPKEEKKAKRVKYWLNKAALAGYQPAIDKLAELKKLKKSNTSETASSAAPAMQAPTPSVTPASTANEDTSTASEETKATLSTTASVIAATATSSAADEKTPATSAPNKQEIAEQQIIQHRLDKMREQVDVMHAKAKSLIIDYSLSPETKPLAEIVALFNEQSPFANNNDSFRTKMVLLNQRVNKIESLKAQLATLEKRALHWREAKIHEKPAHSSASTTDVPTSDASATETKVTIEIDNENIKLLMAMQHTCEAAENKETKVRVHSSQQVALSGTLADFFPDMSIANELRLLTDVAKAIAIVKKDAKELTATKFMTLRGAALGVLTRVLNPMISSDSLLAKELTLELRGFTLYTQRLLYPAILDQKLADAQTHTQQVLDMVVGFISYLNEKMRTDHLKKGSLQELLTKVKSPLLNRMLCSEVHHLSNVADFKSNDIDNAIILVTEKGGTYAYFCRDQELLRDKQSQPIKVKLTFSLSKEDRKALGKPQGKLEVTDTNRELLEKITTDTRRERDRIKQQIVHARAVSRAQAKQLDVEAAQLQATGLNDTLTFSAYLHTLGLLNIHTRNLPMKERQQFTHRNDEAAKAARHSAPLQRLLQLTLQQTHLEGVGAREPIFALAATPAAEQPAAAAVALAQDPKPESSQAPRTTPGKTS